LHIRSTSIKALLYPTTSSELRTQLWPSTGFVGSITFVGKGVGVGVGATVGGMYGAKRGAAMAEKSAVKRAQKKMVPLKDVGKGK
jgi:hypothetical protein